MKEKTIDKAIGFWNKSFVYKTKFVAGFVGFFAVISAIILYAPWVVFWGLNTLFPALQIPYNFWSSLAFYVCNIWFYWTVGQVSNRDDYL